MGWLALYGYLAVVALINLLGLRRIRPGAPTDEIAVLIPARNEEENLRRLLPALIEPNPGVRVYVYDDGSEDETAEVAAAAGARVIRGGELPEGWTGKNHACHRLAQVAAEDSPARWWVFLDADVYPEPGFLGGVVSHLNRSRSPVLTGFPQGLPGGGIEPLFLAWVGWVLLATNPFALVSRSRRGHSRFTNGQFTVWRADVYTQLWPNERLRDRILEDVLIGRVLAKEGIFVETVNVSPVLAVRMYDTWRQALDGMSKNSYEITGSGWGTMLLTLLFVAIAVGWIFAPWGLALLMLSGLAAALTMRYVLWVVPVMPLAVLIGAFTLLRSWVWRRTGRVTWKGRTYPRG